MSIALNYMLTQNTPAQDPSNWPLRYVILLWLSLVCMIPFDLAQFDNDDEVDHTAVAIESLAKGYLSKAGLEREGAAILLSRLFIRYAVAAKLLKLALSFVEKTLELFLIHF